MKRLIFRRPQADFDLIEHAAYLSKDGFDIAERFIDAAEAAFTQLAKMPRIGANRQFNNPKLRGIRFWPIPNFEKFLIYYRPLKNGVEVLRVLHSAQDTRSILEND